MRHPGLMPPLPTPFRAAIGLAATLFDEARHLPDKAIELPMVAVSRALQLSMRAQQRYAGYAARGDELLTGRSTGDEPPTWARFDEPVADPATAVEIALAAAAEAAADAAVETGPAASAPGLVTNDRAGRPSRGAKSVPAPRTGAPSAFDAVPDDHADDQ